MPILQYSELNEELRTTVRMVLDNLGYYQNINVTRARIHLECDTYFVYYGFSIVAGEIHLLSTNGQHVDVYDKYLYDYSWYYDSSDQVVFGYICGFGALQVKFNNPINQRLVEKYNLLEADHALFEKRIESAKRIASWQEYTSAGKQDYGMEDDENEESV